MRDELLQEKDFIYRQTDETAEVVGYTGSEERIEIPETINGKPVTAIGFCGVGNLHGVTVVLNNSISRIELDAIAHRNPTYMMDKYSWIHHIEADDSQPFFSVKNDILYSKDMRTLRMCFSRRIDKFSIPEIVETIGDYAFFACVKLSEVVVPDTVRFVGDYAFDSETNAVVKGPDTELGNNVAGVITIESSNKYIVENGYLLTTDRKRLLKKRIAMKSVIYQIRLRRLTMMLLASA